jgi:hypothetical protein
VYIYAHTVTEAVVVGQNVFEPGCSLDEEVLNLLAIYSLYQHIRTSPDAAGGAGR